MHVLATGVRVGAHNRYSELYQGFNSTCIDEGLGWSKLDIDEIMTFQ